MGQGGVSIGALCNAASDYLIGRCLSTTVFQTSSIKPSSKNVGPSYSAAYFFFFFTFFINSKWAWPRFDNPFLIPTSQAELTCSTFPDYHFGKLYRAAGEPVPRGGGSEQTEKSFSVGSMAQRLHGNLLQSPLPGFDMKEDLLDAWLLCCCWLATMVMSPFLTSIFVVTAVKPRWLTEGLVKPSVQKIAST